ncbi:hypothetical protein Q5P01_015682 [Channa striata]|uniref:L27 domain-containing protein n=1 Tax=Channa striata TaxID=64152 RepID=A0AA88SKS2_CHASR|nr:hypothetical protein Q5P01_015682 [Channa striata]
MRLGPPSFSAEPNLSYAQRALELLQQYRDKLDQRQQSQNRTKQGPVEEDVQLQQSLDRVINVFQSQLFTALLDIQEYYELTMLADSKCSVEQTHSLPASCTLPAEVSPQPQASCGLLSTQAFEGPFQPKPLTPKTRSIKSPAPPIPSGIHVTKPPSPTTQSRTPQAQPGKVKYRAPPPPVQSGASKPLAADPSNPCFPLAATSPGDTVNALETSSGSLKSPTGLSLNGTKPHLNATNSGVPSESSATSANPQSYTASSDLNLVTVSALVSSTIQGFVSPPTPDKLAPTSTTTSTIPGPNTATDVPVRSQSFKTCEEPASGKVTPNTSPSSSSQAKFTFSSLSPTSPSRLLTKGPQLRYKYRCQEEEGASPGAPKLHQLPCHQHPMEVARELRDGGTLGREGGTLGREGGTLGREGGTLGREGGTLGRKGGTLGREGGTLGREGGTLGRDGGTWRREGVGFGTMERERERSLGRDGSLGRRCDLRGAELVQVAERHLSQIQHVHGYVTHTHITPAQVESPGVPFDDETWPHPEGERLNEVPTPPFSSLYSQSHPYYQGSYGSIVGYSWTLFRLAVVMELIYLPPLANALQV